MSRPEIDKRIAELSPAQRAALMQRLQKHQGQTGGGLSPIRLQSRQSNTFPLSFAQQRLWFLDQMEPGKPWYNISRILRLTGSLDIAALERALNEIVRRHEALRTRFVVQDSQPVQQITWPHHMDLPVVDLSALPEKEQEDGVQHLAAIEARRPFSLTTGPLWRASLLMLQDAEHALVLTWHHIIFDGWSMGVFLRELRILYAAFSTGQPSPLEELVIQYADYAVWQQQQFQGAYIQELLAYWQKQLEGPLPVLQLAADRPRPAAQSFEGAALSLALPLSLMNAIQVLSQREGTTPFMTCLAAFKALLYRYTGQEDILIGSPIANRTHTEIEPLIGLFINTLVLRTSLAGNPTFRHLLSRVRQVTLEAYAHQEMPFDQLVAQVAPQRTMSHTPLFQVMFVVQNAPIESWELPALQLKSTQIVERGLTNFDLTVSLEDAQADWKLEAQYSTDIFEAGTIRRMLDHFQILLESAVTSPDQHLRDLPILSTDEQYEITSAWNDTRTDYPRDRCVHELFEEQASLTPDAVAVVYDGTALTYQELDWRANQLAHHLQRLGVGPETLVGLCIERSLDMIVGLLGILKAGGAYVPLDPDYPQERLAFMLEDTGATVLLTHQQHTARLPQRSLRVVCVDTDWITIAQERRDCLQSGTRADNLAYVTYTSGSTGKPKGVSIIHRGVVRLVKGTDYADLTADDIFLQLAPLPFDASTLEIWGSLLNGARLVILSPHTPSLEELGQVLLQHRVTTLWLTAGLFHLMVDERLEDLRLVRQLLAGGDVLSTSHVWNVCQTLRGRRMINGYGPTENTTFTTCYQVSSERPLGASVPIGRPIANTQVYILDASLQPVPVGVPGEVYIAGDGLARGYLNRSGLTAQAFMPHPFSREPGARLYRTGDLARYLPDGNIEFLGRLDHQLKIRGFRIELGEIEAVLRQHPAVCEAAVVAQEREGSQGHDKRLVAYVVVQKEAQPTASELRDWLGSKLPDYMLPSAFVMLDAIPLTPIGKVDRRALPAPDKAFARENAFVAPRTPTEETVAEIWKQVFLHPVGVEDNFFDLGGHSLLATRVISLIRKTLAVELPLRSLFESPTVAGLAEIIDRVRLASPAAAGSAGPVGEFSDSDIEEGVL